MIEAEWNEVDGVPVAYFPDGAIPGPLSGGLVFGVGRADETLPNAGITHLVEHLALNPVGPASRPCNGEVRMGSTTFTTSGRPHEVVEFFGAVAGALGDLPVDDMTRELAVLEIEGHQRGTPLFGEDLTIRFGPVGPGVTGWRELGFETVDADAVQAWCRHWFTASNAALWLSGPVPDGLSLAALPQGRRPDHAPLPEQLPPPRSYCSRDTQLASVSIVAAGEWGSGMALGIVRERAFDELRFRRGLSYSVGIVSSRIGRDHGLIQVTVDGAPGTDAERCDALVDVLEEFVATGPSEQELERYRSQGGLFYDTPAVLADHLDRICERRVLGLPGRARAEVVARWAEVTPESMRSDLAQRYDTALVIGRADDLERSGWSTYDLWSEEVIDGPTYRPINGRERGELSLGPEGATWSRDATHRRSVRWSEVVASVRWPDGARSLVTPNGSTITLVPWAWQNAAAIGDLVDGHVRPDVWIDLAEPFEEHEGDRDPLWLCTILGALHTPNRADVVVTTVGVLVLPRWTSTASVAADVREKQYRTSTMDELRQLYPKAKFIPADAITVVGLRSRVAVSVPRSAVGTDHPPR